MTDEILDAPPYLMRFEFRVTTYFNIAARNFEFELAGRPAVLRAVQDRPLKETGAVTIQVTGFESEIEAREFGYRVQRASTLTATKTDLGIDVGDNVVRTSASALMREQFYKAHGRVLRNRVHGIDVYPETPPSNTIVVEGRGTVLTTPEIFLRELDASFEGWSHPVAVELEHSLRLRAEANIASDNLVRMILAIASVEALTPDETWTDKQTEMLQWFATNAANFLDATPQDIEEVVERITGQRKLSVNQGFRRLFLRLGVQHLWTEWSKVYNIRSKILHGDARPDEARVAVDNAMRLSKEIVLTAASVQIAGANSEISSER